MNIKQAIILAGGLGTRLRDALPALPKCMAPVAGRPFLFHVINSLRMQGIERFIFSLGYKHEIIEAYLADNFARLDYQCVIENEPLGTGGAIQLACHDAEDEQLLVTNGDTLFKANIPELASLHNSLNADCTLALKPMKNFERYGAVEINRQHIITGFKEKQYCPEGLINGGVYILNKERFLANNFPDKFSFEKDFLEAKVMSGTIAGFPQDEYFIDIGIPEDYNRAQTELQHPLPDLKKIDSSWTLFLDRDGVINEDKVGSYIFTPDEFVFTKEMPAHFKKFAEKFKYIIVVTNQRGVGRELMTEKALKDIHQKMVSGIKEAGGRIDAIYYCTAVDNKDPDRKPNPGMIVKAKKRFADIDLSKSLMIGNNISDMQLGRNAGIYTVFVRTTHPDMQLPHPDIDLLFDSLADFAKAL
jgi:D-glycero-alpha-D-manno-heptose 1-phosphate guanylyltransferase